MTISEGVRRRVVATFDGECAYCRVGGAFVYAPMELDHIWPEAKGGRADEANLCLTCPFCNLYKRDKTHAQDPHSGTQVALFHPRQQRWHDHCTWAEDQASILGITPVGRATVEALQMNHPQSLAIRQSFVQAGWYPPRTER